MRSLNGSPASSRRYGRTSWTESCATSSVAWSRTKSVPATTSSPNRSRISAAISSSPVASGNLGALFLGALRPVALPPAEVGLPLDHVLQLDDPVHQGLWPGWAAGDVDVDGHELIGALHHRVVVEHPRARGAGAHRDHPLRLQHLVIDAAYDGRHLDRDPAGQDD